MEEKKKKEFSNIKHIAKVNGYSGKTTEKLNMKIKQNISNQNKEAISTQQKIRVAVTYTGPYIRTIMNIFKDTNIQITYKPTNKIGNYVTSHNKQIENIINSGIYELTCHTCKNSYIGQTSRDLNTRYKEDADI
jgi:hypothetical protein